MVSSRYGDRCMNTLLAESIVEFADSTIILQSMIQSFPSRRLEDRIRKLCARAIDATTSDGLESSIAELHGAVLEFTLRAENRTAAVLHWPQSFVERRGKKVHSSAEC